MGELHPCASFVATAVLARDQRCQRGFDAGPRHVRVVSTANAWRMSIIESSHARRKSSMAIGCALQDSRVLMPVGISALSLGPPQSPRRVSAHAGCGSLPVPPIQHWHDCYSKRPRLSKSLASLKGLVDRSDLKSHEPSSLTARFKNLYSTDAFQ
jgi:hypothetical protein